MCIPETARAIRSTGKGAAESDRVAAERHVHIVDIILVVRLPVRCASHLYVIEETKFSETVFCLEKAFTAAVHMIPSALKRNANTSVLAVGDVCKDTDIPTFRSL